MKHALAKLLLAAGLLATPLLSFASGDNTPDCEALDRDTDGNIHIDSDLDFEHGDLVFREDGKVRMRITEDRELYLDGKAVPLDARGQELVDDYYGAVEQLVDDALDIAGDAAGLGVSAMLHMLAAVFDGEEAVKKAEARVEARAAEIEEQANNMCKRFRRVEDIERELAEIVPGFETRLFANN